MDMRNDWTIAEENFNDIFYNSEETILNVRENFDIRRFNTSEGQDIDINGVTEKCLVQTSNNPLRELNDYRKIHCPLTADVKRGYYVKYDGSIWIIDTNVVDVDGAYLSTRMSRCNYILRWQNKHGDIVERFAYSSDQTKYSNGEYNNGKLPVGDNQYGLLLPIDSETKQLKRGMRFVFDFNDVDSPDVYRLSNRKIKLNDETHDDRGGTIQISFTFDFFNKNKDKRVKLNDNKEVWICDYHSPTELKPPDETAILSAIIYGNENLKFGYPRNYSVEFRDKNENEISNFNFNWNVISDFPVKQVIDGDKIQLSVDDENYIGSSFLLCVCSGNEVIAEMKISIIEGF